MSIVSSQFKFLHDILYKLLHKKRLKIRTYFLAFQFCQLEQSEPNGGALRYVKNGREWSLQGYFCKWMAALTVGSATKSLA